VRDVVFQDDPFRDPLPAEIAAYLEAPRMEFGCEPMNDNWIEVGYGAETLERLKRNRISCCGTVMGTTAGIRCYLEAFVEEVARLKSVAHGADTSVHNVLVRHVLKEHVAVVENFQGSVGTINSDDMASVARDGEGCVLGAGGVRIPVLHQYDRHAELAATLRILWCQSEPGNSGGAAKVQQG
jgi:hypothetical protein